LKERCLRLYTVRGVFYNSYLANGQIIKLNIYLRNEKTTTTCDSVEKPAAKPRLYYGYVIVAAGFFIWLIAWGTQNSYAVFFTPLSDEFGWSHAETVLAYSTLSIVLAFSGIFMGWLTDRLGPRKVVTIFGSFLGIAYLLMSHMNNLWQFEVYYALFAAIGLSTATIPIMATIARWFTQKRGLMSAIVQTGTGLGGFILAPFSGWLIISYGWRLAYTVIGVIALVIFIIAGLTLKRNPSAKEQLKNEVSETSSSTVKKQNTGTIGKGISLREAMHTSQFWIVAGVFFSFGFCRSGFIPHLASHAQELGFSLTDGAQVVAILTISSIAGRFWLGRMGSKKAFIISFAVTTVSLIWALFTADLWGLYLFSVIFGIGWGAQAVLRFTISADTFGLASIGLIMGVLVFPEAIAAAIGSYLSGYLFDITGSYQLAFGVGIPISIAGIILAATLKPIPRTG
jgi:MFS family permease